MILAELRASEPVPNDHAVILANLEEQLAALDRMGAGIAAVHLDAAIQQLRIDMMSADISSF